MDSLTYLEHLSSLFYNLGFEFFAFGDFKEMSEVFGLFLLLSFGFKSFCSIWSPSHSKSRKSKNIVNARPVVLKHDDVTEKSDFDLGYNCSLEREDDYGLDVSALRKGIKMERRRSKAARAEVERERAASATAAEQAMAMIQRLQIEKSSMEMEWNQYRRLEEARRAHDEEVIQSLEWLVARHEAEMSLLLEELRSLETGCVLENVPI